MRVSSTHIFSQWDMPLINGRSQYRGGQVAVVSVVITDVNLVIAVTQWSCIHLVPPMLSLIAFKISPEILSFRCDLRQKLIVYPERQKQSSEHKSDIGHILSRYDHNSIFSFKVTARFLWVLRKEYT